VIGNNDQPPITSSTLRTEVRGLDFVLNDDSLSAVSQGKVLLNDLRLTPEDAERLRIEMAKAQLWEWNQLEELRSRAHLRYRRYLASWLVMYLAAFSSYVGYPDFYLPIFFLLISMFLWWRAGYEEQRAEREAQAERAEFRSEWDYIQQRLEES
jgi:hypothetical protein